MAYPFPGMNPWLEDPRLWRGVHTSLITTLRNDLAAVLAPRYFVDVETHTYIATAGDAPLQLRYPDVTVIHVGGPRMPGTAVAPVATPVEVDLPRTETIEEPYLQIRFVPTGEVVTVIELLSHTNKRPGRDRDVYIEKRAALIEADVHFVEIDFLRAWPTMPFAEGRDPSAYRIFVHRRDRPFKAYLYPFSVRDPIPVFLLPLLPEDPMPPVDLGSLLRDVYDTAHYELIMDYGRPPEPPLTDDDAAWAANCASQVN